MGQGSSTHPIHCAGRTGDLRVVRQYLKSPAILNRRDADDMTCLHWASQLGHIEVLQELLGTAVALDMQDVNGWTPLMHACCRGHKIAVGALLAAGANVDIASHDGRTALHRAATWRRLGPLDQVIDAGGNVHHEANNKWTPLHCAAAAGDAHACTILLEAGADPDAEDALGLKPLDVVADITAIELVTQILTHGRRRFTNDTHRFSSPPRLAASALATLPPSLGSSSFKYNTGTRLFSAGPASSVSVDSSESPEAGAINRRNRMGKPAPEREQDLKSARSSDYACIRRAQPGAAGTVPTSSSDGNASGDGRSLRRGSWTRPHSKGCGTPQGGKCDGGKKRSKKVAIASEGESQCEAQAREKPEDGPPTDGTLEARENSDKDEMSKDTDVLKPRYREARPRD